MVMAEHPQSYELTGYQAQFIFILRYFLRDDLSEHHVCGYSIDS
jgi:lipid-A-disaccharide synthase-like uncharacterized protein